MMSDLTADSIAVSIVDDLWWEYLTQKFNFIYTTTTESRK